MRTSRDETSPPGPPPGPALRPLPSSHDPCISPLAQASRASRRPNPISTTRRGAVSGKHMAQMPTATLLFASRWAQEDGREDECLELGTSCPWCFTCGRNISDLSSNSIMTFHQAPAKNPARALAFGEFEGYTMASPTDLEGDTLVAQDICEKESAPVSPKTFIPTVASYKLSRGDLESRVATTSSFGAIIRPPPCQVNVRGLPRNYCDQHTAHHHDEPAPNPGTTSNLLSRPRFATQTTIDRPVGPPTHQGPSVWDLPIGESHIEAYRLTQEELNAWSARAWARNIDKHGNTSNKPPSTSQSGKEQAPGHTCHIPTIDDNPLQHRQIRNLFSASSSLPTIGGSTSSLFTAARPRDFSGTTGVGTASYRGSSGSYMPSSPPIKLADTVPSAQWHRRSLDPTAEGQYYESSTQDPPAPAWRRGSADTRVILSHHEPHNIPSQPQQPQPQQKQQQASGPSPARVNDIFSVRPLAIKRPFEPARYVDGGPHASNLPMVRPDGNFSHPLTTSLTLPNLVGTYGGYGGLRAAMSRSQTASEVGADDTKNTCLWLEGLPANITYAELTASIKNCGRIYSTYINPPIAHHQTSAAKLAFFTRAGAERLHAQATRGQFLFRKQRVFVRWNRNAYTENPRHGSSATRILLIRGPRKWVNEITLTSYFTSLFWSNICRIDEVPMDVAAAWTGSNWLENGEEAKLSLPEKFREFAAMRWEFASFHSQASSAKTAIESETAFGGLIKVNFLPDPCDYTGSE